MKREEHLSATGFLAAYVGRQLEKHCIVQKNTLWVSFQCMENTA